MDWNTIVPGCVQNVPLYDKDNKVIATAGNVASLSCVPALFIVIVNTMLTFAGLTAMGMLFYAGFKFIDSTGDPKQLDSARNTIKYAIIGLLVVFLAFFAVNFIAGVTGLSCIQVFGFDSCK